MWTKLLFVMLSCSVLHAAIKIKPKPKTDKETEGDESEDVPLSFAAFNLTVATGNNQSALFDMLFNDYRPEIRPICGEDAPIDVHVGMAVRQVIDLDEPKQIMTVNAWLRLKWYDCQLKWDPDEHGGISDLIVPYSQVWTPDITLYDNADGELEGFDGYRPVIHSDGTITYNFPTVINSLCLVDVTSFPFDTQKCPLPFGSWAFHGLKVNVTTLGSEGDTSSFKINSEWDLIGVPAERHEIYYGCCPEPYPDVTFYVSLRRKPLFYLLNLLFPCVLISAVALLGFLLPPDSGEKVSLEITVLLALSVFMLVVSETLPPTSESFPLIGIYFFVAMTMVTLSTVLSVFVVNVHYRGELGHKVPGWMRYIFLGRLARLMCVKSEGSVFPLKMVVNGKQKRSEAYLPPGKDDTKTNNEVNHNGSLDVHDKSFHYQFQSSPLTHVLNEQLSILKRFDEYQTQKEKDEEMENEWKTVALVMDRFFLLLFSTLLTSCTVGILVYASSRH